MIQPVIIHTAIQALIWTFRIMWVMLEIISLEHVYLLLELQTNIKAFVTTPLMGGCGLKMGNLHGTQVDDMENQDRRPPGEPSSFFSIQA